MRGVQGTIVSFETSGGVCWDREAIYTTVPEAFGDRSGLDNRPRGGYWVLGFVAMENGVHTPDTLHLPLVPEPRGRVSIVGGALEIQSHIYNHDGRSRDIFTVMMGDPELSLQS